MNKPSKTKPGKGVGAARKPLSKPLVLQAAIGLADEAGIATLSMRKLAQRLGVEAMSLYNHVANKEALFDGMVDSVIGEIGLSGLESDTDWKAAMRHRAHSAHQMLLRHPWASQLIVSRINIGPANLRYLDATIACLHQAGFSYPMADRAWNAIDSHIYGFTLQELNFPFEPSEYAGAAQDYLALIPASQYPHMNAMAQQVISGIHSGVQDFEFGLELILDGLERLLNRD